MSGIGSELKMTRESLGLTLDHVQQSTKIHIEYLRALENDQFETLPSPFYVRAFLRTYAHSLGLDAQPLLDRYERFAVTGRSPRRTPGQQGQTGRQSRGAPNQRPFRTQPRLGRTYPSRSQRTAPPSSRLQQYQPFTEQQQYSGQFHTVPPQQGTSRQQPATPPNQSSAPVSPPSGPRQENTQRHQLPAPLTPDSSGQQLKQKKQEDLSQTGTFTPRRVSQEVKRGESEGDGRPKKKGGFGKWMIGVATVGALLLVPVGYLYMNDTSGSGQQADGGEQTEDAGGAGTDTVNANENESPTLAKVETGSDVEGDLYNLQNAKNLKVEIKASKGESRLDYGEEVNDPKEGFTMEVGEQRVIGEGNDFVWFRVGKPSNVQIKVNGQDIDTTAQDVPKSYRIQLKK
ncbi:helix-turn-helix domain-containing protein [Paludifilum halophilum]|uniref:DUF4115 domain-containing protein n=1 Tax=Paludifilum halophilum TaxID=1642702 RepID=A0A235BBC5_9BACL|nr:helix-turn-helix transcriptional regulator [Paludifilum halophilum]OYD09512.1 hypothetical protein CHM34_00375 [Paludifilum halophilum]